MFSSSIQRDNSHVGLLAGYVHFAAFYTSFVTKQVSVLKYGVIFECLAIWKEMNKWLAGMKGKNNYMYMYVQSISKHSFSESSARVGK